MSRLERKVFDLKLAGKQMAKNAQRLKRDEAREMQKCWKHVKRGEHDVGRVHAENAVRNRNQGLDMLRLGARLRGAVDVLQAAIVQNRVTAAMESVVVSMTTASRSMHLPSLAMTMNRFERMNEHLDMRQAYASRALDTGGAAGADDDVDLLMARIVDMTGLEMRNEMPAVAPSLTVEPVVASRQPPVLESTAVRTADAAELDGKLARLRNRHHP